MSLRQQYEETTGREKAGWVGSRHDCGRVDRRKEGSVIGWYTGAFGSMGARPLCGPYRAVMFPVTHRTGDGVWVAHSAKT